ncbi:hypothetical protein BBP40_009932 [Aspergillus hancockii]|nr:hypothetical protein BBP40_009932 [Aspergillus hancockii]
MQKPCRGGAVAAKSLVKAISCAIERLTLPRARALGEALCRKSKGKVQLGQPEKMLSVGELASTLSAVKALGMFGQAFEGTKNNSACIRLAPEPDHYSSSIVVNVVYPA